MSVDFARLDKAFNPKVVAVVGDKGPMYMWLRGQMGFKGKLYSVQVDPKELDGIKELGIENYKSLLDVPEPVDLVIVAVPRPVAYRILEDCIKKNVAAAHFFTSGFGETDTEEGIRMGKALAERAKEANFYLVGPNCMGLYNPSIGIRQTARQQTGFKGNIGFISQSGTHAITFSEEAHLQTLLINKSVSFGNGVVLDCTDYLEYFARDPDITAIGMYLEGTRDGPRFLKTLKEVAAKKPVVIWKGGRTEEGGRHCLAYRLAGGTPRYMGIRRPPVRRRQGLQHRRTGGHAQCHSQPAAGLRQPGGDCGRLRGAIRGDC